MLSLFFVPYLVNLSRHPTLRRNPEIEKQFVTVVKERSGQIKSGRAVKLSRIKLICSALSSLRSNSGVAKSRQFLHESRFASFQKAECTHVYARVSVALTWVHLSRFACFSRHRRSVANTSAWVASVRVHIALRFFWITIFLFFTNRAGFETLDVRLRMSSFVFRFLPASTTTLDTPCTCGGYGAAFYPSWELPAKRYTPLRCVRGAMSARKSHLTAPLVQVVFVA
ncbi:MAG: hypothetical protein IPK82_20275 [Polyangiaceae bacterium]|nr:hypothetical protein [Polyangiaceae bacterium]